MTILRISQANRKGADHYTFELELAGDGAPLKAKSDFRFALTDQDRDDLRWYLEDYLQLPQVDPQAAIAARIEGRLAEIGGELFVKLFESDDARDLWAQLRGQLADARVEISTDVAEALTFPWELLRDPKTGTLLALQAQSFVRTHPEASIKPVLPKIEKGQLRILLVICRPGQDEDVPFRSVAGRLLKSLDEAGWEAFQLDVLRPPTYVQLAKRLGDAKKEGKPYHIVHFDGHGDYADSVTRRLLLNPARAGSHGFLLFENPKVKENMQYVDGPALGRLLHETGVPVLDMNACRSSYAEAQSGPKAAATGHADPHAMVRAFGTLAQEVMDQGVAGVVAMRYNVYVVTAAQFVANLYSELAAGHTFGEAVALARKNLADQPSREIAYDPRSLQDWSVPVVYEAAPIALLPKKDGQAKLVITVASATAAPRRGTLDEKLPKPPDVGFFGRDETLLALDRAFDNHHLVLLHQYAGCGKTATAAEFAGWYSLTGGIEGPVLFSSFERYLPLPRVLDKFGVVFGSLLEQSNMNWPAFSDAERRGCALQVLKQIPLLWIWDNVEPIAGFPTGTESQWKPEEQKDLVDFLRDATGSKAKFLLTSRRDEVGWLGQELPHRIMVPPMPMQERVQLARAIAERHGRQLADVEDWLPLLQFTKGNPMTLTAVVGQALRDRLTTAAQIEAFVANLRAGEATIEDDKTQRRDKSLAASLGYGFRSAFNEPERKQLALLHLFQGFVDVDALRVMGDPEAESCLEEIRGLTREQGITLLDRAAEVGLLTAHGSGYYSIHPALPWYFNALFAEHYPDNADGKESAALGAQRAFVGAMGQLANFYHAQYGDGNTNVIATLLAEEDNLLYARRLARLHRWWRGVILAMQGLRELCYHTGRQVEWRRYVDEIVPDFINPTDEGSLSGLDEEWGIVTEYRVRLLREERDWEKARGLQSSRVDRDRRKAQPVLKREREQWNQTDRHTIRSLAVSLHELGELRREMSRPDCVDAYVESFELAERLGDHGGMAACAHDLGNAYMEIPEVRNLDEAEKWHRRGLGVAVEMNSHVWQGQSLRELGSVELERYKDALSATRPDNELLILLRRAETNYCGALELIPVDAPGELAVIHNQLGILYGCVEDWDRSLHHSRESIRLEEGQGSTYGAAGTQANVAHVLVRIGRLADAFEYARAALRGFEQFGAGAAEDVENAKKLIAAIEQAMQEKPKAKRKKKA